MQASVIYGTQLKGCEGSLSLSSFSHFVSLYISKGCLLPHKSVMRRAVAIWGALWIKSIERAAHSYSLTSLRNTSDLMVPERVSVPPELQFGSTYIHNLHIFYVIKWSKARYKWEEKTKVYMGFNCFNSWKTDISSMHMCLQSPKRSTKYKMFSFTDGKDIYLQGRFRDPQ